ncbi:hypothetical protein CHS0354_005098 [Potamilus streckersoni]|uniref:Uncharacterized protein n=1 Tax=Potamilus streckersoni TaxID=2493646 RepID=A0AAE0SHN0_9BIVA|nr:hypothetical protein CHS0354_005098 [Potamilus streckersoni]
MLLYIVAMIPLTSERQLTVKTSFWSQQLSNLCLPPCKVKFSVTRTSGGGCDGRQEEDGGIFVLPHSGINVYSNE